jgi:hypothetical protein
MARKRFDENRCADPEVVAALDALLASGSVKLAHYVGYAHEAILRVLHEHLGNAFSLMDYWNRYGVETELDWETGERVHESRRPDWLRDTRFFTEGGPTCPDLLIWDMPLSPERLLQVIDRPDMRRPVYLLLAHEARTAAGHPDYTWTIERTHALGYCAACRIQ